MIKESILFYDLETTALEISKACILECYITNWSGSVNKHWYVYPSDQRPIENSHIHHITDEVLREKNAVTVDVFMTEFCEFVDNYRANLPINMNRSDDIPQTVYLVAHNNNRYDKLVLAEEFKRKGREHEISRYWSHRDSLVHFRRCYPNLGYGKYRLGELYNRFRDSIPNLQITGENQLHSAVVDTEILRQLYIEKIANQFKKDSQFQYFFVKTL